MNLLAVPAPRSLQLLIAPPAYQQDIATRFTADLALAGSVRVLDGGNRFDVLRVNRELRARRRQFYPALKRVQVARAFTCYQMVSLLEQTAGEGKKPTLVLNLLTTFRDENVPLPERQRLLASALHWLDQMAHQAPVMILLHPPPEEDPFLRPLRDAVDQQWEFASPRTSVQLSFF